MAETKFYCKRDGCAVPGFLVFEELLEHQRKDCPSKREDGRAMSKAAVALTEALSAEAQDARTDEAEAQATQAEVAEEKAVETEVGAEEEAQATETEGNMSRTTEVLAAAPLQPGSGKRFPDYSQGPSNAKKGEMVGRSSWRSKQ